MTDMGKLIERMTREGTLMKPPGSGRHAEGVRVRLRGGKLSTIDGPFTETKEVIGGFAILERDRWRRRSSSRRRFLAVHGDEWDLECEVRQMEGPEMGADA